MTELEPMSPDITLFHILPRLPVKSVSRFKCVSKQWHSFIRAPGFPKMHLHHLINNDHQNHQKLLFLPDNRPWDFFTIDCETPEDGCTAARPLPFKVRNGLTVSIATSLHGMVCVLITKPVGIPHIHTDILLWNPVTGDHKTLSKAGSHKDCYDDFKAQYGLYYSSSEDDYKLLCVTERPNKVYIYSLKSDSWRKVKSTGWCSDRYEYTYWTEGSVLLNEKLYLVNSYSIMMFDTQTEKLRDIKTPHFGNRRTRCIGFMVVRDCIHFCLAIQNSIGQCDTIEQWRMDGDGDWTKVETSSSKQHLYWSYAPHHCHVMRNGNWLMYSNSSQDLMRNQNWTMHNTWRGCVYVIDAKKHARHIMCSTRYAFRPQGRYIETFVSPNQYLK